MRLRLFERLGRLVGWRPGSQDEGSGRPGDSRADGTDVGGRHRRNVAAGTGQPGRAGRPRPPDARPRPAAMQPPALRASRSGPPQPRTSSTAGRPAAPRNCRSRRRPGPRRRGGGVGRARIREAPPFGAAPVETATARRRTRASQPPAAAAQAALVPGRRRARAAAQAGLPARDAAARHCRPGAAARGRPARPGAARARLARDPAMAALPFAAAAPARSPGDRRRPPALRAA